MCKLFHSWPLLSLKKIAGLIKWRKFPPGQGIYIYTFPPLPLVTSDPQVERFFAKLAGQIPPNKGHDLEKRTLQSKLRETFVYLFIYQLFWTQACPEGMCTNGTHRSHARCHPCPIPQPVKVGHITGIYDAYSFPFFSVI